MPGDDGAAPSLCNRSVLLMCTGSVAAIKLGSLCEALLRLGPMRLSIVATACAMRFLKSVEPPMLVTKDVVHSNGVASQEISLHGCRVYTDDDEWSMWSRVGDPVLHIELRRLADVVVIAPLDANTLAKLAHGLCDNLVSCVMRAWDVALKPVVVAPAMNTFMWDHPHTAVQLQTLARIYRKFVVVEPVEKVLACGDCGKGALAGNQAIVDAVVSSVSGA